MKISYDSAIPLFGIYLKNVKLSTQETICPILVTEALFIMARIQKQHNCLCIVSQINQIWYIHTTEYYSAMRDGGGEKNENKFKSDVFPSDMTNTITKNLR